MDFGLELIKCKKVDDIIILIVRYSVKWNYALKDFISFSNLYNARETYDI